MNKSSWFFLKKKTPKLKQSIIFSCDLMTCFLFLRHMGLHLSEAGTSLLYSITTVKSTVPGKYLGTYIILHTMRTWWISGKSFLKRHIKAGDCCYRFYGRQVSSPEKSEDWMPWCGQGWVSRPHLCTNRLRTTEGEGSVWTFPRPSETTGSNFQVTSSSTTALCFEHSSSPRAHVINILQATPSPSPQNTEAHVVSREIPWRQAHRLTQAHRLVRYPTGLNYLEQSKLGWDHPGRVCLSVA